MIDTVMECTCPEWGTHTDPNCPMHGNLRTKLDNKRNVDVRHMGMSEEERTRSQFAPAIQILGPLFAPGSWVLIGDNIPATVRQICISANGYVEYEVVWWDERDREAVWLAAYEVKAHPESKEMEVGFHALKD